MFLLQLIFLYVPDIEVLLYVPGYFYFPVLRTADNFPDVDTTICKQGGVGVPELRASYLWQSGELLLKLKKYPTEAGFVIYWNVKIKNEEGVLNRIKSFWQW